jgi:hypothetical protein
MRPHALTMSGQGDNDFQLLLSMCAVFTHLLESGKFCNHQR